MLFSVQVEVSLRAGVADPQGATIERSLADLGFDGVRDVRVGKSIRFTLEAPDEAAARAEVEDLCAALPQQPGHRGRTDHARRDGARLMAPRVGVVLFPGSNCEQDVVEAVRALGGEAEILWHGDADLGAGSTRSSCRAGSPTATTCVPAPSLGSHR